MRRWRQSGGLWPDCRRWFICRWARMYSCASTLSPVSSEVPAATSAPAELDELFIQSRNAARSRRAATSKSASRWWLKRTRPLRSEEHTSELQSRGHLVCRLLLEKKKQNKHNTTP